MTQGEAVFQAVSSVFGDVLKNDGRVPETTDWSDGQASLVFELVLASYKRGEWTKASGGTDEVSLRKYIPGLVNNWVRKDPRMNGGTKYEPKRPGSRAGTGDEGIKAMRTLLAMTHDETVKAKIQVEIDKRLAELKPKQELNVAALPESLRHLIPS